MGFVCFSRLLSSISTLLTPVIPSPYAQPQMHGVLYTPVFGNCFYVLKGIKFSPVLRPLFHLPGALLLSFPFPPGWFPLMRWHIPNKWGFLGLVSTAPNMLSCRAPSPQRGTWSPLLELLISSCTSLLARLRSRDVDISVLFTVIFPPPT